MQEVCALFGQPVAGNPTQYMMEKALARAGLEWRFLTFEIVPETLGDAVRGMRAMGFRGAVVVTPFQVAVVEMLDELRPSAKSSGTVNCIFAEDGKLIGENTVGQGFVQSISGVIDPAGKTAVILGAGGTARAVAIELAKAGVAKIIIVNRTAERGEALAKYVHEQTSVATEHVVWDGDYLIGPEAQIVVHATTIGMNDPEAKVRVSFAGVSAGLVAIDVVASPSATRFLRDAKRAGATTVDGIGMTVHQASLAFRLWTGIDPDESLMRDAAEEYLSL
jgi:shikimate dehydrogenase